MLFKSNNKLLFSKMINITTKQLKINNKLLVKKKTNKTTKVDTRKLTKLLFFNYKSLQKPKKQQKSLMEIKIFIKCPIK